MDLVHDRGSMDPVHTSGPWTRSKEGVHGPLVHVLSSPPCGQLGEHVTSSFENLVTWFKSASYFATGHTGRKYNIEHDL